MHNKEKILNKIIELFWLFVIGSIGGYIFETILVICKGHYELRTGFVYGYFIPVYGIGLVVYHLVLSNIKFNKLQKWQQIIIVFFITAILGGITEYISSFLQEKCFGTISWDYTYLKINFAGRTSLLHSCYWGIMGTLYYLFALPLVNKIQNLYSYKTFRIITVFMSVFIIFDIIISSMALYRQNERRMNIEATSMLQIYLDSHYTDEYLKSIYPNMKYK